MQAKYGRGDLVCIINTYDCGTILDKEYEGYDAWYWVCFIEDGYTNWIFEDDLKLIQKGGL